MWVASHGRRGYGWYLFHHHHIHVSFNARAGTTSLSLEPMCLIPGCDQAPLAAFYSELRPTLLPIATPPR